MTQLFLVSFMGELLLAAVCVGGIDCENMMSPKEPEQSSKCHLGRT